MNVFVQQHTNILGALFTVIWGFTRLTWQIPFPSVGGGEYFSWLCVSSLHQEIVFPSCKVSTECEAFLQSNTLCLVFLFSALPYFVPLSVQLCCCFHRPPGINRRLLPSNLLHLFLWLKNLSFLNYTVLVVFFFSFYFPKQLCKFIFIFFHLCQIQICIVCQSIPFISPYPYSLIV